MCFRVLGMSSGSAECGKTRWLGPGEAVGLSWSGNLKLKKKKKVQCSVIARLRVESDFGNKGGWCWSLMVTHPPESGWYWLGTASFESIGVLLGGLQRFCSSLCFAWAHWCRPLWRLVVWTVLEGPLDWELVYIVLEVPSDAGSYDFHEHSAQKLFEQNSIFPTLLP